MAKMISDAFQNSDTIGKIIVLLLLVFSFWVWEIMILKAISVAGIRKAVKRFNRLYAEHDKSPLKLAVNLRACTLDGPLGEICKVGLNSLIVALGLPENERNSLFVNNILPRKLTPEELDKIRSNMNQAMNSQQLQMEDKLAALGSLTSISPMFGLFGTVWGVMATFIGIVNNGGRPDIQAIAPGISGALLTTVAGLAVAIPSLCGNNWIISHIQTTDIEMDSFIEEFITSLNVSKVANAQQEA